MRSVFYVAVAVAILACSSVVAAFTNADESKLLSKTIPDFAADVVISSDSRKRFLRVTDLEDGDLEADDEERVKIVSLKALLERLDQEEMGHVADVLRGVKKAHYKSELDTALQGGKISEAEKQAALTLLSMLK